MKLKSLSKKLNSAAETAGLVPYEIETVVKEAR